MTEEEIIEEEEEEIPTNLTLYITPTELGKTNVNYNGEMYEYGVTEDFMNTLKSLHKVFKTPEDFLKSELAELLQEVSDEDEINITVNLYDEDDNDIAWFEFWPEQEIYWDSF